jgi:hypothetical protein
VYAGTLGTYDATPACESCVSMQKGGETMLSGAGEFSVASSTNVELNIEVSTVAKMKAPKKRLLPFAPITSSTRLLAHKRSRLRWRQIMRSFERRA